MNLTKIAKDIQADNAQIILIYSFNSVGKTRLCVAYKDFTKHKDGTHSGVYYNAFSEDIFIWENDDENDGNDIRLIVRPSSLSRFHTLINEENIREKLSAYKPKYDFRFKLHKDSEKGIESISFFIPDSTPDSESNIKISRGEERIFVWCFFLALFEVEGWADKQSSHFFIDDPVSSQDDHNIFISASTLFDLVEDHHESRKIIITTHHIGLYSILADWLTKGEKASKYKDRTNLYTLTDKSGDLSLEKSAKNVFLYHLRLLQMLQKAHNENDVRAYHLALLRQVLENVASFLGVGQFQYVLEQIGIEDPSAIAKILIALSHKKVYYYESDMLTDDVKAMFDNVFNRLLDRYHFVLHTG